jgi:glycosyltransferase involved in cell wall biosynthesis
MPAHNEAEIIGSIVSKVAKVFKESQYSFEILVVNDASKDSTGDIADKRGATVINHILNTGAGGATATGLSYAQQKGFDIAATMDSDGQHLATDVLKGVNEIIKRKDDLLIGSRLARGNDMSITKVVGNKGLSIITYLLFGVNCTDSQSGLRIFSKQALKKLQWTASGYEFCSEMLWRAKQLGLSISEYPITTIYTDYSKFKGQSNWNGINIVKSLVKQRIKELLG